ncbi:MAG TPA: membrane protein insertase YidC [Bryobacteraceae bacterium]|nr:membrane protein insertase YidC [Bryobacteraceae bacterium]
MADLPNTPGAPKKELTMEIRLLIAFLLMGLVLFVTPYIYKAPPPPKPVQPAKQAEKAAAPVKAAEAAKPVAATAAVAALPVPGQIAATSEQLLTIDTQIYHIVLSNHGAVAQTWVLKKYKDHNGKPLDLVNPASFTKVPPPLSLALKDDQEANAINFGLYVAKPDSDGLGVQYEFSDGVNYAKKSLRFTRNGYLTQITTEVTHNGAPVEHMIAWRGGFGDPSVLNRAAERHAVYYDLHAPSRFLGIQTGTGTLITKDAKAVKDGPYSTSGDFSFAGLDDKYFAGVFLPKDNTSTKVEILKDDAPITPGGKEEMQVGVEVGGDSVNHLTAFVGPKDVDLLRVVDTKLQQLIDWGWYGVIARPIFIAMHWLNDTVVHNYGWSIVLVTIAINLIVLPLRFSSLKSQRRMQRLQPQIQAINAKYKGLSLRDPKKAQQNQEVMELYKKEGVNPMGGCLPMLIQLPLLYAFYKVLNVTIELRGAHWLWVTDLTQPEQLAIHLLPIIMIGTQFISQKMTPTPGMDPSQARMMAFMPLMFGFLFYNASSGLVLYWLTSNVVGIVQQWMINKTMPPPPAPAPKLAPKKKN